MAFRPTGYDRVQPLDSVATGDGKSVLCPRRSARLNMPVKVLRDLGSCVIVGDERGLHIVDRLKRCKGYQNGCHCTPCSAREALRNTKRPQVAMCGCESSMSIAGEAECFRCGKTVRQEGIAA